MPPPTMRAAVATSGSSLAIESVPIPEIQQLDLGLGLDGLAQIGIHAGPQAALAVLLKGVSRQP